MIKNIFYLILAAGLVAGTYIGVSRFFGEEQAEGGQRPPSGPIRVEAVDAVRRPIQETLTYPGTVMASETVTITPKVTGTITAIHVAMGDFVEEGTPLFTLDDSEYVERLKQAEANQRLSEAQLRRTQTAYDLAKREYDRAVRSGREGISSQRDLDTATANLESTEAEMEVARAEMERMRAVLEEAQLNLAYTKIHSPVSGWVQARPVDAGALASPSTPVLTIVDMDPAEVVVYVPEREIALANAGVEARVVAAGGALEFTGMVTRASPSLRVSTRTAEVVIDVPNPDTQLKPGMSANVTFVAKSDANALVLPASAIVFQNDRSEVYRIEDGIAYAVPVETGIEGDGYVQILSGIAEGDRIVVKGQFMIEDGARVTDGTTPASETPITPRTDS